jgi:hypothetical protein
MRAGESGGILATAQANSETIQTGARTAGSTSERSTIGHAGCDDNDQGDDAGLDFSADDDADLEDPWQKDASDFPNIPTDDDFPIIATWEQQRIAERRKLQDPDA